MRWCRSATLASTEHGVASRLVWSCRPDARCALQSHAPRFDTVLYCTTQTLKVVYVRVPLSAFRVTAWTRFAPAAAMIGGDSATTVTPYAATMHHQWIVGQIPHLDHMPEEHTDVMQAARRHNRVEPPTTCLRSPLAWHAARIARVLVADWDVCNRSSSDRKT